MPTWLGSEVTAGAPALVYDGPGKLQGWHISHAEVTVQQVIIYDTDDPDALAQTDELLNLYIDPTNTPHLWFFPEGQEARFAIGLCINTGNCKVTLWYQGN